MRATILIVFSIFCCTPELRSEDWPGWRGPRHDGISTETAVPLRWGPEENVAWKVPVPGVGHSSPIAIGDRLFVTSCVLETLERRLTCFDRTDGHELWKTVVAKCPIETMHRDNTPASATPVTDGEHVFVAFQVNGKLQVTAYTVGGEQAWQVDAGSFESRHGFCTSLVLDGDRLIVSGLQDGPEAFVAALDKHTGRPIWKTPRAETVRSFSSPLPCTIGDTPAILLSGANQTVAYDRRSGQPLWDFSGPAEKTVSSIVICPETRLAFVCGGRDKRFYALQLDEEHGDGRLAWEASRGIPYMTSPLAAKGLVHILSDEGVYRCYRASDGKIMKELRAVGPVRASMVATDEHIFITEKSGKTTVITNDSEWNVIAENEVGEEVTASVAISNGDLIMRTAGHLLLIR